MAHMTPLSDTDFESRLDIDWSRNWRTVLRATRLLNGLAAGADDDCG